MCFRYSFIEIPQRITMREVWAELNGTIIGLEDISVENGGKLYIWSYANTEGSPEGTLQLPNIAVKAGGKFEPLTTANNIVMKINVTTITINGNGYVRTNHLELYAVNCTIDLSGMQIRNGNHFTNFFLVFSVQIFTQKECRMQFVS